MPGTLLQALLAQAAREYEAGHAAPAESLCRQILAQDPHQPQALHLLAILALQTNHLEEALALVQKALAVQPAWPEALNTLGTVFKNLRRFDDAIDAFQQALLLAPEQPEILLDLGTTLKEQGKLDEAIQTYRRCVAARPTYAAGYNNLGMALLACGQVEESIAACRQALRLQPQLLEAHTNLGNALRHQGQLAAAAECYEESLRLRPHEAGAKMNLAITHLLAGNFQRGWEEYESRWQSPGFPSAVRHFPQPLWTGQDLTGKTILLHSEQGSGDAIQFVRFAPLVAQRGARIIIECQAQLVRLFQSIPNIAQVLPHASPAIPPGHYDYQCPFLSLPRVFNTTLDTIPNNLPYLSASPDRTAHFAHLLTRQISSPHARCPTPDTRSLRVGLAWAGGPHHPGDRSRSLPLRTLEPLFRLPDISFISLQAGPAAAQIAEANFPLLDLAAHLTDFQETAALIAHLDLIISVDTAVAHLAGALAKPTWLLLPFAPDWRWLLHRADSPWYPTMRLFRQSTLNDWSSVIATLTAALPHFAPSLKK